MEAGSAVAAGAGTRPAAGEEVGAASGSRATVWLLTLPAFAVFLVARLPSFWEPHWYTDEAGYVTTAQTLLHGQALYSGIWTNKPPLTILLVAALVHFFGTEELALHVLTFLTGAATVAAVYWTAWRLMTPRRAVIASLIAALALGLPVLDAELLLPESILIAPIAWAGAIIATRLGGSARAPAQHGVAWWALAAGVLVAAAIALQQSALAETLAFTIALFIASKGGWRRAAAFLVPVVLITAAWVTAVVLIAGAHTVAFALVGFYIPFTQSVLPSSTHGQLLHFGLAALGGLLFVFGAWQRRRDQPPVWFFLLWAGAALMVAGVSGQPYAHYVMPAAAPVALSLASIGLVPARTAGRSRTRAAFHVAPQATGVLIAAVMASNAGLDWVPSPTPSSLLNGQPVNNSRNFSVYYGGAIGILTGQMSRSDWENGFDSRVAGDAHAAQFIIDEGLSGARAVVWSSDAWVYALAGLPNLMPTPPIYNDEVLLGQNGQVATYVGSLKPDVIVTSTDALATFPEIKKVLDAGYVSSFWFYPDTVWVRADIAPTLR